MNTRSFIFFTRILARAQISSLTSESFFIEVLSVTILETTKTNAWITLLAKWFYRSQFWRLQKPPEVGEVTFQGFIGHNFGDYKNLDEIITRKELVLSVTILETTKTAEDIISFQLQFYRSQFWRLQKPLPDKIDHASRFIGHNFGDYKNLKWYQLMTP